MSDRYDIIIIGGGNAGFGVSAIAADAGKKIAFIESREFGGTCPNRGCTPKKVLVAAAHAMHEIDLAPNHGIEVGKAKLNWQKLIKREKEMISFIPDAMAGLAKKRGDVYVGTAAFNGPNSIDINRTTLEADNIIIATGSKARELPIPGAHLMITSDEVLSDETQPERIVFIGGGVIAMEFSHVYAHAGSTVTILEAMPDLLARMDTDAVTAIRGESERLGITIKTSATVKEITEAHGALRVTYEHEGAELSIDTDRVVNCAGRVANVDTLNLEAANVEFNGTGIVTDAYLRSVSNPAVWVCGDALVTSAQLSPLATYEGRIVGQNIVHGPKLKPNYAVVPNCVFTVPALASVGLSEKEAADKGLAVKVSTSDMTGWFSAKSFAEPVAWAKILVDEKSNQIVGAHMVGHKGEELIHFFAMAMRHNISATALKEDIFAFPTFANDLKNLF